MLDRIPPHSRDAELAVIGSMLVDPRDAGLLARERLGADDFYLAPHQILFREIAAMLDAAAALDMVTLSERLRAKKLLDEIGGPSYIAEALTQVPTAVHVEDYIATVADNSLRRKAAQVAYDLIERTWEPDQEAGTAVVTDAVQRLAALCAPPSGGAATVRELIKARLPQIEERWERKTQLVGLATGYSPLDGLIRGLRETNIIVIAGFPGEGKSTLAVNIATNIAKTGAKVLFHNIEMTGGEQVERMLAAEAHRDMGRAPYTDHERERVWQAVETIIRLPMWVSDGGGRGAAQIAAESRRHQARHGCDLVVVDYLQKLPWPAKETNENMAITRNLAAFGVAASQMRVPWIILSQFNRAPGKEKRRPNLQDLRGSGSIEQDANVALLISRVTAADRHHLPEQLQALSDDALEQLSLIDVAKNRNGDTGVVTMRFCRDQTRFDALDLRLTDSEPRGID